MKAPIRWMQGKRVRYEAPDKEWLEYQYVTLDKSAGTISKECGIALWATVCRWLREAGLPVRSEQEIRKRHSVRMSGAGNPSYIDGTSQNYQKRLLRKADPSEACAWCGSTENVQIHHIDHDRQNANLDNLMWLCHHCNVLEASLYHLSSNGRTEVIKQDDMLTIRFTKKEYGGAQ